MSVMSVEERNELVDMVAQAVIDRIEERDRINGLANLVIDKVIELQRLEAALIAEANDEGLVPESQGVSMTTPPATLPSLGDGVASMPLVHT